MRWIKLPVWINKKKLSSNDWWMAHLRGSSRRINNEKHTTGNETNALCPYKKEHAVMETLTLLISGVLFSVFATTLSTSPQNTNTHHHISGSAGSAASSLALLTNRYSNNHLPSVLSGQQPMDSSSCLRPPSPLILGALRSVTASIH